MKFKKVIYWIGIYAVCSTASDFVEEIMNGLGRRLHRWSVYEPEDRKEHRSIDMKTGKAGRPIDRIGF